MKLRPRKGKLTREDTLRAKPVRNQAISERRGDKGDIILIIPRKKDGWIRILSRIFYLPRERNMSLDEIGSWVWQKCDGQVSVGEMIEDLSREFKINPKEAEVSLLSFLKKLTEKRLIGFLIKER